MNKIFISIRVVSAKDYEEAEKKIIDGEFLEAHLWNDIILEVNEKLRKAIINS